MRKVVELERPALWRPIRSKGVSIRKYAGAYPYMKRGIAGQSTTFSPVVRYAKNYKSGKLQYSIVFFSHETDMQKAEDFMDAMAKTVKQKAVLAALKNATMGHMDYLNKYYDEEMS